MKAPMIILFLIVAWMLPEGAQGQNTEGEAGITEEEVVAKLVEELDRGQRFLQNRDLDGDGQSDSIWFHFSQGAHCCYYLRLRLTSDGQTREYPFDMDGGYVFGVFDSQPEHFNIKDYDGDGLDEILMEILTYNGRKSDIPEEWKTEYGISEHQLVFDFQAGELQIISIPEMVCVDQYFLNRHQKEHGQPLSLFKENGHWGYEDERSNVVILPVLDLAHPFSQGVAVVDLNFHQRLIDTQGRILWTSDRQENITDSTMPEQGLLRMQTNLAEINFLNQQGEVVNPTPLESAKHFSEGLVAVLDSTTNKWGYMDTTMTWVIPPQFSFAGNFEESAATVSFGVADLFRIDTKGQRLSD